MLYYFQDDEIFETENSDASDEETDQNELIFSDSLGLKSPTKKVILEECSKKSKKAYHFRSKLKFEYYYSNELKLKLHYTVLN